MVESSILFSPEISERDLDREVDQVNESLQDAGQMDLQVDDSELQGLSPDGIGGMGGGGGLGGGGMGGVTGGAAAGGLASRLPKPVAGLSMAKVLPVALGGAVGVGMLNQMKNASGQLQATSSILGITLDNVLRPIGDDIGEWIMPFAKSALEWSDTFGNIVRNKGLDVGLSWAANSILTSLGDEVGGAAADGLKSVLDVDLSELTWGDFVTTLEWASYLNPLTWSTWIGAFAWDTFVDEMSWPDYLSPLTWPDYLSSLTWSDFANTLTWSNFVTGLEWLSWLSPLKWNAYVADILWDTFVPNVDWGTFVPNIDWSDFIPWAGDDGGDEMTMQINDIDDVNSNLNDQEDLLEDISKWTSSTVEQVGGLGEGIFEFIEQTPGLVVPPGAGPPQVDPPTAKEQCMMTEGKRWDPVNEECVDDQAPTGDDPIDGGGDGGGGGGGGGVIGPAPVFSMGTDGPAPVEDKKTKRSVDDLKQEMQDLRRAINELEITVDKETLGRVTKDADKNLLQDTDPLA